MNSKHMVLSGAWIYMILCQSIGIRAAARRPANRYTGGRRFRGARDYDPRSGDWRVVTKPGSGQRLSRSRARLLFQRNFGSGREQPQELRIVCDFHAVCVEGRLSWKFGVLPGQGDGVAPGCRRFTCHYHRRDHPGIRRTDFGPIHALRFRRRAPAGRGDSGFYTGRIDWQHRRVHGDAQQIIQ